MSLPVEPMNGIAMKGCHRPKRVSGADVIAQVSNGSERWPRDLIVRKHASCEALLASCQQLSSLYGARRSFVKES